MGKPGKKVKEEVYPLFSSPVVKLVIDDDFSDFEKGVKELDFQGVTSEGSFAQDISIDRYILNKFPREKDIFLHCFDCYYKDNILKANSDEFKITTSWATRTIRGSYGQFHCHTNSMFSGVFYFEDADTEIEFQSYNTSPRQLATSDPDEWNIYNSRTFRFTPQKNMLLLFPSYLYHKIGRNNKDPERISVAFNLFPNGTFGNMDSTVKIQIQS